MSSLQRALVVLLVMVSATVLANVLQPERAIGGESERVDLEKLVPSAFSGWSIDPSVVPVQVSPDVLAQIDKIYEATLSRTYVNASGVRVMLSIAYGSDQTGRLRVHRPESCYSAQGFSVKKIREEVLAVNSGVPAKRLLANAGGRVEPITYWIRVGDTNVSGNIEQRLVQLRYGLSGEVPDGVIFRVSSIERDLDVAYRHHDQFIADINAALSDGARRKLIGRMQL